MNRSLALLFLLTTAWGLGSGCGRGEREADFRFLNTEPETIDPGRVSDQAGGRVALNLFEGLTVREAGTLRPAPGMAESWEVEDEGRRYVFHLRDAQWSDGRPVTGQDFVYAWTRLLDPATGARYSNLLFDVRGAREFNAGEDVVLGLTSDDPRRFVVELQRPVAYFLDLCSFYALLPVPRWAVEQHGDAWIRPGAIVSNGAFTLEEWQIHRRMRLQRNPRYWDAARVSLRVVDVMPGDFANGNFNRYESGLLDWVDSGGIPPSLVDVLRRRDDWHAGPFLATYFLRFNLRRPPFDDARVRQALFHAVDAAAICEYVTRAGEEPAHSLVPPGLPGYAEVRLRGFEPELARSLLAEAGYPGGEGFPERTLLFNTSEAHRQIAEVLQQQWKDTLGIEVQLQNQEWRVFSATVQHGDYDLARGSWIGDYLDPNTFLDIWTSDSPNNRTGFARADYDSLVALAARTLDPARRMEILRRCEEIVCVEECVILPIHYYVTKNLYDPERWEGLEPDLVNHVDLKRVRRKGDAP